MPNDQNISEMDLDEEYARLEASLKSCRAVVENYRDRVANDVQAIDGDGPKGDPQPI